MTAATHSPDTMNVDDLIAHLASKYHEKHQQLLPDLIALAQKVERVHHDVADAPIGLATVLDRISRELDMHTQVEEKVVFSAMRQKAGAAILHPIELMRGEHAQYAADLDDMEELAHGFVPPADACGSWRRLYQEAADFSASLREQMRIENEILFPRFEVLAQTRCTCAHS